MTYSDKVKASKDLLTAIQSLDDKQYVIVEYGTDYKGEPNRYKIDAFVYEHSGKATYRIYKDELFVYEGQLWIVTREESRFFAGIKAEVVRSRERKIKFTYAFNPIVMTVDSYGF